MRSDEAPLREAVPLCQKAGSRPVGGPHLERRQKKFEVEYLGEEVKSSNSRSFYFPVYDASAAPWVGV
jgi:hypothetical protein